jgi:hypothetical protein
VAALFVAVVGGIAVAVSGGDDSPTKSAVDTTEATEPDEVIAPPSDSPPASPEPPPATTTTTEPEGPAAIGPNEWFTWTDGLEAQVTSVEQYTPDYDDDPTPDVAVTVTVKNGTGHVFDGTMMTVNLYGGPNGTQAESGYDFYGFDGSIPVGGTATAKWSFMLPAEHLSAITVEVAPGWSDDTYMTEYEPAFFTGSAA